MSLLPLGVLLAFFVACQRIHAQQHDPLLWPFPRPAPAPAPKPPPRPAPAPIPKPSVPPKPSCVEHQRSGGGLPKNYNIPAVTWLLTPSIVNASKVNYRAIGRIIYADYLKERLEAKDSVFTTLEKKKDQVLIEQLEILADTLFIEGTVNLYGIKNVKIYTRDIVARPGSKLIFNAPNHPNIYDKPADTGKNPDKKRGRDGQPGASGKDGIDGPHVDIFTDVITGKLEVHSNAGNGQKGQDGGKGGTGGDNGDDADDRSEGACRNQNYHSCSDVDGFPGKKGYGGGNGGNAGLPGRGGEGGLMTVRYRAINGNVLLKTCGGVGAEAAKNGEGGAGGKGSKGGKGRDCKAKNNNNNMWPDYWCSAQELLESRRGDPGPDGDKGKDGTTSTNRGSNGNAWYRFLKSGSLDAANKRVFPVELVKIMRRQAEDLLISDTSSQKGKDTLTFIIGLANARSDLEDFKKDAQRKLGFLGKPGYDIFGNNELFAPSVKWKQLQSRVVEVKQQATDYETAFNEVMDLVNTETNFKKMATKISQIAMKSIEGQIDRLVEAKRVADAEKWWNVRAINTLEDQMEDHLEKILEMLKDVHDKATFNRNDLITVLQSVTGFAKAITSKSPLDTIAGVLGTIAGLSSKKCLKSLPTYLASAETWLKFGKAFSALNDSSELDFDQLEVSAVPEMMKVNLDMNKENLAAELVCLLDVASLPPDVAPLKAKIESYFIAGSARIDLIAKVMDLDNDMGGYLFDIPVLNKTRDTIRNLGKSPAIKITTSLQQSFTENLLTTYEELEHAFVRNIYKFYKAIEFRTLWDGKNPLAGFQRVASESAQSTNILTGVIALSDVYTKVLQLKNKAVTCFSRHSFKTDSQKWTFDKTKNKAMFDELASVGKTNFTVDIDNSCETCFNVRLLKIYIELFGDENQPANVPSKIHISVRHHNSSSFRAGDKTIKQYIQKRESKPTTFDRHKITDEKKCQERKKKGQDTANYCLEEQDSRWEQMCTDPLSLGKDILLGAEECVSPFGVYDLEIPVDKDLECGSSILTASNCKDLDLSKFTKMNVWTYVYYWVGKYPVGPQDIMCSERTFRYKDADNQTAIFTP